MAAPDPSYGSAAPYPIRTFVPFLRNSEGGARTGHRLHGLWTYQPRVKGLLQRITLPSELPT